MALSFLDAPSPMSLAVAAAALLLGLVYLLLKRRGLPPGPTGLPYFGIWPFLDDQTAHFKLHEMTKKYGDVFSFTCTGRLFINLGSVKALREAHITKADCFGERSMDLTALQKLFEHSVLHGNGELWKVQRKFFLMSFKERGVKAITDTHAGSVRDIINQTLSELRATGGTRPLNIAEMLTEKCTTTLRLNLFGEDGTSDKKTREIIDIYEVMVAGMTPTNMLLPGKFGKYFILPFKSDFREALKTREKIAKYLFEIIDEHKTTFDETHIRDVIDEYFNERNRLQRKGDPAARHFTDQELMGNLVQFIGDGVLGVSYAITGMIRILIEYPEEQDKIYREIVEQVGPDRLPTIEDKPRLPYLNAFILEVMRLSDFFAIFPALECTKETTLRGYRIPKGAITILNLWSSHHDPENYEDPYRFNPSRFITTEGKKRPDLPVNFGVGKRACLGEGFAMTQYFLFMGAIVKNFRFSAPKNTESTLFDLLVQGQFNVYAHPRK